MKLARPNLFHPRIVLASCGLLLDSVRDGAGDDAGLVGALRKRGLHATWLAWDDPQTEKADLVIVRAVSDLDDRREEFLAWTTRVRNLLNAPAVLAWNSGQHYLADLTAAGVPVAPRGDRVKARATGLVFLGGEQSHAVSISSSGKATAAEPDFELWDLGYAVLEAACVRVGVSRAELLCGRVDLIGGTDAPWVRGLDLIQPDLSWRHLDIDTRAVQQRRFALGVESACERLGLGPLSHRGP